MNKLNNFKKSIHINISTISEFQSLDKLISNNPSKGKQWESKCKYVYNPVDGLGLFSEHSLYEQYANQFPEFGKICCVSFGIISENTLNFKTITGDSEYLILQETLEFLKTLPTDAHYSGFNLTNFIIPFLFKRSIINGIYAFLFNENLLIDVYSEWNINCLEHMHADLDLISTSIITSTPHRMDRIESNEFNKKYYGDITNNRNMLICYTENRLAQAINIFLAINGLPNLQF